MTLTKDLLKQQDLEFTNSREDLIEVSLFKDKFNIWLNGSIIENTKSLKQTQVKLNFLKSL
jgi:hypothetical protein